MLALFRRFKWQASCFIAIDEVEGKVKEFQPDVLVS